MKYVELFMIMAIVCCTTLTGYGFYTGKDINKVIEDVLEYRSVLGSQYCE